MDNYIMDNYKEALEEMVWQFAHRSVGKGNKSILWSGGLSALERAFKALGWDNPKVIPDTDGLICDVKRCSGWVEAQGGMWADTGYWCLCAEHSASCRRGNPQPQMKQRAMAREASRDETGRLPIGL